MSSNHVDRRSINAVLFEAFLGLIETTPTTSCPQGYDVSDLRWLLRRAALLEAARRVQTSRERLHLPPFVTYLNDDNLFLVRRDGEWKDLTDSDRAEINHQFQRLTRGLPEIQGRVGSVW